MMRGLTKKLDFEKGSSKSKTKRPDYRSRFVDEGDGFDRGGSHGNRITLNDVVRGRPAMLKVMRGDKLKAITIYERQIRSTFVQVGDWKLHFRFTAQEFGKANGISFQESQKRLPELRALAEELLRMTLGRAHRAALEAIELPGEEGGRARHVWRLRFKTFLPTIDSIEWSRIYKRVQICPLVEDTADDHSVSPHAQSARHP